MGSGAFLVAACRYLTPRSKRPSFDEGQWHAHDITPAIAPLLRRLVASRCLFGVDLNPMAVQLARLSLWLATLAANKPLSFLDHHLVTGNSLVGATPNDVRRQPSGGGASHTARRDASVIRQDGSVVRWRAASASGSSSRRRRTIRRRSSARKNEPWLRLQRRIRSLGRWLACARPVVRRMVLERGARPDRPRLASSRNQLLEGTCRLPTRCVRPASVDSDATRSQRAIDFFIGRWSFPEVFLDDAGPSGGASGFDAVIGNPPWDMVRGDSGEEDARNVAQGRGAASH